MIENLGSKLYSGLKQDRKSDSLGSSADGTNNGITLTAGKLGTTTLTTFMDTLSESPNGDLQMYNGSATYRGEKAETSSSALIGAKVTKVTFKLKRNGTPTGTASVDVINATGTVKQNIGTISQATLQGLSNSSYSDVAVENTSATYVMVEDDQVVINYSGGDSSNHIYATRTSSNVFDGTNSVRMYNEGSWATDSSLDTIMKIEGYPVRAYSFDASSDSVDIPADINLGVTGTSSFTITGWFNLDSVGANREIFRNQVSNGQAKVEIYYTHGNQTIICDLGGTTTKILSKVETGKWYHLTIRRVSGDKDYFYINGHLSQTNSTQSDVTGASGSIWYIGNRKEKNEAMIGKLDDIGFFSRALEESEIQSLTNTTVTQGYKGGLGGDASPYSGGGGGGAGGAGANGSSGVAGAGGVGIENPITGSEVGESNGGKYWLGGGGGGFGNTSSGAGGKGGGSGNNSGDNGTANTGGGAGARNGNTGAGGSGVVLVSYQTSQITDGSSDGSLETGSNIPSGYAIRKFVLTGSSTENFDFVISSGSGNVQYVIVGGGGGGGTDSYSSARASGGGGGGGFVTGTKSMSAGTYSVTVGRGGGDVTNGSNNDGGDGDNSVFDGTTAYGGGGGATHYSSESSGFWGRAGCKGTGGGGNNSSITRGLAVYNTDTGALVSSLTNKSELKANYTMDTEGTQAWGGFTKTDDYDISSYENQPRGCFVSTDGTYFYVVGDQGHSIDQFTMSTPYDLTTISHTRVETIGTNYPRGIYFKEDGTKMFIIFYGGVIKRWTLGTAWDISSMGSSDQSDTFESDSGDYNSVIGLYFKPDGTKFYVCVGSDNAIKQYDCGSAWDVSSMSGSDVATRDSLQGDPSGLFISSDGLRLWYCDYDTDKVYQWNFATAWDITTGSVNSTSYSVEANPFGFTMKTDGTKFYLVNDGQDEIQEFTGGKSCPNDFSSTSDLEALSGVRTNSIFQQSAENGATPSYWWYNGTSWVLDGTTQPLDTDFSSSTGWTEVAGSSSTKNFTVDTANNEMDCKFYGSSSNGNGSVVYYDLGSAVGNKWVLRFTINYSTMSGNQGVGFVGLFDETTDSDDSQDGIYVVFMNNDNQVNGNGVNGATPDDSWGTSISATLSTGTNYFVTLARTAEGTATIDIKTVSHSGSSLTNYPANCSNISSSITGLRYIKVLDRKGYSGSNGDVATIKDLGFQNGTTEWLE